MSNVQAPVGPGGQPRRRPDVVCYLPESGPQAIDAILELKLILNDEDPKDGLTDLKAQLLNARHFALQSKVLGLVLLAAAPLKTPGTFDKAVGMLRLSIEQVMPDAQGFSWVAGHEVRAVFRQVMTRYHFPSMAVSLALGVRELVQPPAVGGHVSPNSRSAPAAALPEQRLAPTRDGEVAPARVPRPH